MTPRLGALISSQSSRPQPSYLPSLQTGRRICLSSQIPSEPIFCSDASIQRAMAETTPKAYSADPTLYLYTSLTAGSSHIITATSRLETILKANKIPFRALDVATDEKARMLWGRRSKGRKLPGLVRYGSIVGVSDRLPSFRTPGAHT